MASQRARMCFGFCVALFCLLASIGWTAEAPGDSEPPLPDRNTVPPQTLSFVRQFSSAQDVKRAHVILDRTLDIIAGPKPGAPVDDILETPHAITTDSAHRVIVTDVSTNKVHVFDFGHSRYFVLQGGGDGLRRPAGVAADRDNNIFVTDSVSGLVSIYDAKGKFRRYLKASKSGESYFERPMGISIDPATENVYVCDSPRHMVIVLDRSGRVLDHFGRRGGGTRPAEFQYPTQVVAALAKVVVLDSGNRRVQVLDAHGHFQREIKLQQADTRTGLAMDANANIYVSDDMLNRVQVFNQDGRLLYTSGQMGTGAGEFDGAAGTWVDSGHCLYVVDAQNRRVQLFQTDGEKKKRCQ